MFEETKQIVKVKLDFNKIEIPDTIIELAIKEASGNIKRYCNLDELPKDLEYVLASMSFDILTNQYVKTDDKIVESIQEGDTKISFKNKVTNLDSKSILNKYTRDLNKFRRIKF